jgi:hypothetical protein
MGLLKNRHCCFCDKTFVQTTRLVVGYKIPTSVTETIHQTMITYTCNACLCKFEEWANYTNRKIELKSHTILYSTGLTGMLKYYYLDLIGITFSHRESALNYLQIIIDYKNYFE